MTDELQTGDPVSYFHHWDNVHHVGIIKSVDPSGLTVNEDPIGCHDGPELIRRWISREDLFRYHMKVITHEERERIIKNVAEVRLTKWSQPIKPTMPLNRVHRCSGEYGICPKCDSGLVFRKYFGLPACLQSQCEDYYGSKMTAKVFFREVIKLCRRKILGIRKNPS